MYDIEVRLEQTLEGALARVRAHGHAAVDACYDDAVSRLRDVDELVVHAERHGVRCLPVGDRVGRLLQPDDLSVRELAPVVHERHGAYGGADIARAASRLLDLAAVNLDLHGVRAR